MKQKILVDTNIFIDFLRGYLPAKSFFEDIKKNKYDAHISVITITELFSGKSSKNLDELNLVEQLLELFKIVHIDYDIAKYAGFINRDYDIGFADATVAASAKNFKCVLMTRNLKHFEKISNLKVETPY